MAFYTEHLIKGCKINKSNRIYKIKIHCDVVSPDNHRGRTLKRHEVPAT